MTASHLTLGPGVEFDVIRGIAARLGPAAADLGDDCALVPVGGATLAVSVDASLEGVHFQTAWLSYEEIGWRAAAAALSDLAAEAARPLGVLVSLGGPSPEEFETIMSGVAAVATSVGAKVLGGDLVRSEKYLVDVCALGTCERPVRRSGARAGDGIWVTGELGGARLALNAWQSGRRPATPPARRFARPEPRIAAGLWLGAHGATAMIDISDGLAADARHPAAASNVGIAIAIDRVPCAAGAEPMVAVASGEEYELLVALPQAFGRSEAREFAASVGIALTHVGECVAGADVHLTERGRSVVLPSGYDHFTAS